jgi:hypothetical protein
MDDYKKVFDKLEDERVFIKTAGKQGSCGNPARVPPPIASDQKAALNRKGNMLFNSGNIEGARRIFMATGYSDGLARVGDYYKSKNRLVEALHMYWLAPDQIKSEPLVMQAAALIQNLLHGEEGALDV